MHGKFIQLAKKRLNMSKVDVVGKVAEVVGRDDVIVHQGEADDSLRVPTLLSVTGTDNKLANLSGGKFQ